MTTGTQLHELQILRGFLRERLQIELPYGVPFEVQCVTKNGELIVLVQHPSSVSPNPEQTFSVLKQAIPNQQPEIPRQVKLYLRVAGQNRPYAFDTFAVEPPERHSEGSTTSPISIPSSYPSGERGANDILPPPPWLASSSPLTPIAGSEKTESTPKGENPGKPKLDEITDFQFQQRPQKSLDNSFEWDDQSQADGTRSSSDTLPPNVSDRDPEAPDLKASQSTIGGQVADESASATHSWEQPTPPLDAEPNDPPTEKPLSGESSSTANAGHQNAKQSKSSHSLLPLLIAGTGIAVTFFFCTLYVLTRPCALGACNQIAVAQQMQKESEQTLQRPNSGKEILEAQKQLDSAIDILKTIPFWSSHYNQAQNLVKAYQEQAKVVDYLVEALKKGASASVKSQNPPHSLLEWQEIQKRWRDAASELEQVPKSSNVYRLAQQKQKAYKSNLAIANKRLTVEQQAKQFLDTAKESAKKAETRQGVAQTLENWYLVYATWKIALNRLSEIPQGTTAYEEAQQLLPEYQAKLAAVRDRTTTEQFAANTYKQSLRFAQQARNFQSSNQWSQAVVTWSNALAYLKQIPSGTYYYSKTAEPSKTYTEALKQAQAQLQLAMLLQQARNDLNQTCNGTPQICTFTLTRELIKVRLTPDYMQKVRNAALSAKARNDYNAQQGVVKHVLTLGEALEAISDNAKIRLEVYTPDGSLRQAHNPA